MYTSESAARIHFWSMLGGAEGLRGVAWKTQRKPKGGARESPRVGMGIKMASGV